MGQGMQSRIEGETKANFEMFPRIRGFVRPSALWMACSLVAFAAERPIYSTQQCKDQPCRSSKHEPSRNTRSIAY